MHKLLHLANNHFMIRSKRCETVSLHAHGMHVDIRTRKTLRIHEIPRHPWSSLFLSSRASRVAICVVRLSTFHINTGFRMPTREITHLPSSLRKFRPFQPRWHLSSFQGRVPVLVLIAVVRNPFWLWVVHSCTSSVLGLTQNVRLQQKSKMLQATASAERNLCLFRKLNNRCASRQMKWSSITPSPG